MVKLMSNVSIYKNKLDTKSKYTISINDALARIKEGKSKEFVEMLRSLPPEEYSLRKGDLPSITFSGTFSERRDDKIISHSGFACLDFDSVLELFKTLSDFRNDEYIYACWISPRGNGIKCLVKIPAENDNHRRYYEALLQKYPLADKACINPSRFCYESYDPDLYINENSKIFSKFIEKKEIEFKATKPITDEQIVFDRLITWLYNKSRYFESGSRNTFIFVLSSALCRTGVNKHVAESMILTKFSISRDFSHQEMMSAINSGYKKSQSLFGSQKFETEEKFTQMIDMKGEITYFEDNEDFTDIVFGDAEGVLDIYDNGYDSAETTHFDKIDPHFKWKKGDITLISGIGNHGKSSFTLQLMLTKSIFNGDKWAMFVPENMPAKLFYSELTEMLVGCSIEPINPHRPHRSTVEQIQEWLKEHFIVINPIKNKATPEFVKSKFLALIMKFGIKGILIDPFNKLLRDVERDDLFLQSFLADFSNFVKHHDIFAIIVAHPTKLQKSLEEKDYACPNIFNIAGGAMWNNGMDNIAFVHRPLKISEPKNPLCEFTTSKIRWKKIVGQEGTVQMMFDFKKRRYYIDNQNPLENNPFNHNKDEVYFEAPKEINSIGKDTTNPYDMSMSEHLILIRDTFGNNVEILKKSFMPKLKQQMTKYKYPISKSVIYREFYIEKGILIENETHYILAEITQPSAIQPSKKLDYFNDNLADDDVAPF